MLHLLSAAVLTHEAWKVSVEIASCQFSLGCRVPPHTHTLIWTSISEFHVVLFFFPFSLSQQPNIKQKFVALLKRFKVTDEVGAHFSVVFLSSIPLPSPWLFFLPDHLYHTSTLRLYVRGSECAFARLLGVDVYFSWALKTHEDVWERCGRTTEIQLAAHNDIVI